MVQLLGGAALGGLPVLCIFMYVTKLKKKGKYNHNFGCRVLKVVETVVNLHVYVIHVQYITR